MKMRKLLAGLAVAATLLGGLSTAAATANADESLTTAGTLGATLTLTATDVKDLQKDANGTAREYKAYQLASITTDTASNTVTVTTTSEAAKTAISALDHYDSTVDPIVWLGKNNDKTAGVAQTLAAETDQLGTPVTGTVDATAKTVTFDVANAPGVYLIVDDGVSWTEPDATDSTKTVRHAGGSPIILSVAVTDFANATALNDTATGTQALKPQVTYGYQTQFTKIGVGTAANGLKGATFNVYDFDQYDPVHDTAGKPLVTGLTSNDQGVVTLSNLTPGKTYLVKEVTVPGGYDNRFKVEFKVTVSNDGQTFTYEGLDKWGLAPKTSTTVSKPGDYKVKNVQNVTQLPLTGAAGTILFSAVGLLLAAAAITVFLKSRTAKRALNV